VGSTQVPEGYKQTEIGMIPEDWELTIIRELKPYVTSGSRGWARYYAKFGAPFIRITNLLRSSIYLDPLDLKNVRLPIGVSEGKRTELKNGDILVSITADIGIVGYVDDSISKPSYINQHIALVRFEPKIVDSKFIAYFLSSENVQHLFQGATDQGAKAGLNLDTIRNLKLAVPPLPEQRSIAQALSDVDALIASLDKLIAKKCHLKTATMQQLLTGKMRLPGFGEGKGYKKTEIGNIPEDWELKQIDEIADVDPENLTAKTNAEYKFKYISLEDVDQGTLRGHSEQVFFMSPSRARRIVRYDDVLLSTVRPNLKSHLIFKQHDKDWVCSTGFAVLRCKADLSISEFLFAHLFGDNIEKQIETLIAGSNYPAISSGDVRKLKIPVPNVKEQKSIAQVLSDMDTEITALETRRAKTQAIKQGMMQELLTGRTRLI
jgi:type I restriction enzyme, S subunit